MRLRVRLLHPFDSLFHENTSLTPSMSKSTSFLSATSALNVTQSPLGIWVLVPNGLNSKIHKQLPISRRMAHDLRCICDSILIQITDTVKAKVVNKMHVVSVFACIPPA